MRVRLVKSAMQTRAGTTNGIDPGIRSLTVLARKTPVSRRSCSGWSMFSRFAVVLQPRCWKSARTLTSCVGIRGTNCRRRSARIHHTHAHTHTHTHTHRHHHCQHHRETQTNGGTPAQVPYVGQRSLTSKTLTAATRMFDTASIVSIVCDKAATWSTRQKSMPNSTEH